MFKDIHDSRVVAYSVDSRSKKLVLAFESGTDPLLHEFTLLFHGVIAHQFIYPEMPSWVLDLVETSASDLLKKEWENITEGYRECGWPGPWASSLEEAIRFCESDSIHGYELEQSYGMSGWILATSVEYRDSTNRVNP
jgi:hypothetical protein